VRRALSILAVGLALASSGCLWRRSPPPTGARADPGGEVTPAFQGMRTVLLQAQALREREDARSLRGLDATLTAHGLGLLQANLPHDLRDGDVERFMDARAAFGEALKEWARARESAAPEPLFAAVDRLVDTYWAWVDAYKGRPPEHSV
jgi:hypothetical protein